ncbi:uncharacterized protein LOC126782019 [Argentina anserina]|uniref:uncharacterized protein LOC126782019 n=1 Tax=Argentina anserina TaxID=57926 RepID=UPI00217630C0|nr:uncharacterized protein LOC126782019 [Potentilla anserina]
MSDREDYDSDAPEEFTAEQGVQQEQELSKLQKENKARVAREGKERRRKWAQKKTPRKAANTVESVQDASENETHEESSMGTAGMLPPNIVELLAARDKQVFSDSEDEKADSKPSKKKKRKSSGVDTIILNQTAPPPCLEKSLEFLKNRKMQVRRSQAVLHNSNQALRFLTSSGVLSKKMTN